LAGLGWWLFAGIKLLDIVIPYSIEMFVRLDSMDGCEDRLVCVIDTMQRFDDLDDLRLDGQCELVVNQDTENPNGVTSADQVMHQMQPLSDAKMCASSSRTRL
jgi:hypothetical protein